MRRADSQLKIRGFRIEPGEIEKQLRKHQDVYHVLVTVENKQLCAYIQPHPDTRLNAKKLRHFLNKSLPQYMIPDFFVLIDDFPLTPNGKIDRKALPQPGSAAGNLALSKPEKQVEQDLARIWREVLSLDQIGIDQNFFELGGNSLVAMRLLFQIEQVLGKKLSIVSLFQHPTIREMAVSLEEDLSGAPWASIVKLTAGDGLQNLFLIPPGGATALSFKGLLPYLEINMPVYGLQPWGMEKYQRPHYRVKTMVRSYIDEIHKIQPIGPYRLAGTCFGDLVAFEIARQLEKAGEEVAFVGVIDTLNAPLRNVPLQIKHMVKQCYRHFIMNQMVREEKIRQIEDLFSNAVLEGEELTYQIKQTLFAHAIAATNYVAKPYGGKVTFFGVTGVSHERRHKDWSRLVAQIEARPIAGHHFGQGNSFLDEPHVRSLGKELTQAIEDSNSTKR